MKLTEIKIGETAVITAVGGEGSLRQHFLDMGVIPGTRVTLVKLAPMGDPMQFTLHGYELSLRLADAEKIEAEPFTEKGGGAERKKNKSRHPGLGEGGKFHRGAGGFMLHHHGILAPAAEVLPGSFDRHTLRRPRGSSRSRTT